MRLSETEWKVMNVVWEDHPVSARHVYEKVEGETGWAFDTVRTILNRLAGKGALRSELRRGTAFFTPILTRAQARHSAVSWIADRAFDGAYGALMHFLVSEKELSREEKEMLRKLLAEMEEE